EIGNQRAVEPSLRKLSCKGFNSHAQHRIEISKDDESRFGPVSADVGSNIDRLSQRSARLQCPLACPLDYRPVSNGIAEGHPQFDHVRTSINRGQRNSASGAEIRVATREVRYQPGFVIKRNHAFTASIL